MKDDYRNRKRIFDPESFPRHVRIGSDYRKSKRSPRCLPFGSKVTPPGQKKRYRRWPPSRWASGADAGLRNRPPGPPCLHSSASRARPGRRPSWVPTQRTLPQCGRGVAVSARPPPPVSCGTEGQRGRRHSTSSSAGKQRGTVWARRRCWARRHVPLSLSATGRWWMGEKKGGGKERGGARGAVADRRRRRRPAQP